MKVKPIKWSKLRTPFSLGDCVALPMDEYEYEAWGDEECGHYAVNGIVSKREYRSVEDAKRAAEKDWEKRVLQLLEKPQ